MISEKNDPVSIEAKTAELEEGTKEILSTTEAFGLLRRELIDNLGVDRVKGFLLRYGWRLGARDAEEAMKKDDSLDFLLKQASLLHLNTGHVGDIQSERRVERENDDDITSFEGIGRWIDSFEAKEHIKHHGVSDNPVCHTLTGYANGYMSTVTRQKVLVVETSCVGKGDEECIYETKLLDDWDSKTQQERKYYEEKPIVEELEYTYEQLLKERNYIDMVADFHKRLTESVSNGSGLKDIADSVHDSLHIPVSIEDLSFENISFSGLGKEEFLRLDSEFQEELVSRKNGQALPCFTKTKQLEMPGHVRLVNPIFLQKKVVGYCTFVYPDCLERSPEQDVPFIERMANVCSLILLNEKTSFEALEKMKGNLLEQLLMGDYASRDEIISRGRYMNFDFEQPYYIAVMNSNTQDQEHVLETISKFLDIQGHKALVGFYDNRITMYIPSSTRKKADVLKLLEKLHQHMEHALPDFSSKIAISDEAEEIGDIEESREKALITLRMSEGSKIADYEDLGILGVLINSKNTGIVKEMAKKELGPLFEADKEKNNELTRTLYVFLSNGGNLQQTMDDLALSMSGLTYRKNKIEKLIGKDLRNPAQSYQLLLILDSLIALNELQL
ncbi:XylR N-terminal domain-containing protein [Virgibacillus xinjiangensis]|uniref:XylR N-terminal domain-containing protein n=1 Tax=Virgibacillus xinjiangensis TaxID=393090 RepID=A0ABV7CZE8_9BACI